MVKMLGYIKITSHMVHPLQRTPRGSGARPLSTNKYRVSKTSILRGRTLKRRESTSRGCHCKRPSTIRRHVWQYEKKKRSKRLKDKKLSGDKGAYITSALIGQKGIDAGVLADGQLSNQEIRTGRADPIDFVED